MEINYDEIVMDEEKMRDVGYYRTLRSSTDKRAMIWGYPKFDKSCGRWFESMGGGFCSWRDIGAFREEDELDVLRFRERYPKIVVRESTLEFRWSEDGQTAEDATVFLQTYRGEKSSCFSFSMENATKLEQEQLKQAIQDWHCTGEIEFGRFKCSPSWLF